MCAECHSTDLRKNYDLATDSYKTTWFEINVACEACHGPGSRHAEWAKANKDGKYAKDDDKGLTVRPRTKEMTEACFRCHARRIVRATAFQLLREHVAASQLPHFQAALRDPDPQVRGAAVASMEGFQPETRWQFAGHLLSDPVRYVRYQATPVLAAIPRSQLSAEQAALLDRAVAEYMDSQSANADMAPYHINIGVMSQRLGKPDRAETAYKDAIRLDPTFAPAYVNLADLYREQKKDHEGEQVLRRGSAAAPNAAEIHYALGLLLVRQKRPDEALPQFRKADSLRPDLARYALAYALALEALGQRAEAMDALTRTYRRHPHDRDLLFTLATFSRDRGKMQDAIRFAKELAAVAPEDTSAKRLLKELETRQGGNP